jgi:PST family polysaccharide transporter
MFLLARYLSIDLLGQLSFAIAFGSIISVVAIMGTDGVTVHELITKKKPKNEVLGSALWIRIIFGITIIFLSNLGLLIFKADYFLSTIVFIISLGIIFQAFEVIDLYFQSTLQFKKIINARIISLFFSTLIKIFFLYYKFGIIYIASSFMLDSLILAIFLIIAYNQETFKFNSWKYKKNTAFYLIKNGSYLFISSVCVVMIMQMDKILIGFFSTSYDLGIYSAATQFTGVWNIIPVIIGVAIITDCAKLYKFNKVNYEDFILKIFRYLTFLAIGICCIIIIFGKKIIIVTIGERYAESADILYIYIFTIIFIFHVSIRTRLLIIENSIDKITYISILTLITSVILNILLISLIGIKGAAYATVISWGLSTILFPLFWTRTRHYPSLFLNIFFINFKKQ